MKNKIEILALLLSILCVCVTGAACAISFEQMGETNQRMIVLESEIQNIEQIQETAGQTEAETARQTEAETARQQTEMETEVQTETEQQTETETEQKQENGLTVAIDPGHQGSWVDMSAQEPSAPGSAVMKAKATTGTTGSFTQIPEYELNLDISLALREELENRGYRVVMTRTDHDTAISNAERAVKAYEEGGDIYVRIHANGSEDSSVSGALGMTPSYDNAYVGHLAEESYRLTDCILSAYCQETGFSNLGIQYHDDMTGINWSQIPVMILEMVFMTNEYDDMAMADEAMRRKMVTGIANGIDAYFGRQAE